MKRAYLVVNTRQHSLAVCQIPGHLISSQVCLAQSRPDLPQFPRQRFRLAAGRLQRAASGISPSVCSFSVGETQFCPDQCSVKTECRDHAYQMELFDAGFNEWGFVDYTIHQHDARGTRGAEVASGSLQTGHFGVHDLCIREPGCYSVTLAWGWWAEEVSWVLGEKNVGVAASGGAPAQCDFSVGGDFCPATCMPSPQLTGCGEDKLPYELELYDDEGDGLSLTLPKSAHEASAASKLCSMQSASCLQMYAQSALVGLRSLYHAGIDGSVLVS